MAGVRRFQDLDCWRLATELADLVDEMTASGPVCRDRDTRRQLRKSATKAPAQISEGFGRYLPRDFANYLRMARASLCEATTHLDRGRRRQYWTQEEVDRALKIADRAIGATTNLMLDRLRAAEAQKREPRASSRQRKLSGAHPSPSTNAPGTNAPGTNAPGTNAPGTNAPGTNAPGTNAPGTNAPGTNDQAPGTQHP